MMHGLKSALRRYPALVDLYRTIRNQGPRHVARPFVYVQRDLPVRWRNYRGGGLPLPPPGLMFLVANTDDAAWFLQSGRAGADCIRDTLRKNGVDMSSLGAVLDFGCGVGRVLRHFAALSGPQFYGTDYNARLINWDRANMPFARFELNSIDGPLEYPDGKFDLVYALSVFTHLMEPNQHYWIEELVRIVKPGGLMFITTHGDYYRDSLQPPDRARFDGGDMVAYGGAREGSNFCAAFHPESYVRTTLARGLEVVDFIPEGALGNPRQDLWLLRKTAS